MTALTFDTHTLIKTLKAAGASEDLAEAITGAVRQSHEAADVAKLDAKIDKLETSIRHDIRALDLRLSGEMRLLKWMMGVLLAGTASLILKAFF